GARSEERRAGPEMARGERLRERAHAARRGAAEETAVKRLVLLLVAVLSCGGALAHKPSDSYLTVYADGQSLKGQWDIALRDLEYAVGLDADGDGAITWGELKAKQAEVDAYVLARLALRAEGKPCRLAPTEHLVDDHTDGAYAVLRFDAKCEAGTYAKAEVEYSLFFDLDPTHRGLLRVERGKDSITGI